MDPMGNLGSREIGLWRVWGLETLPSEARSKLHHPRNLSLSSALLNVVIVGQNQEF
jgi:hypothetical protein